MLVSDWHVWERIGTREHMCTHGDRAVDMNCYREVPVSHYYADDYLFIAGEVLDANDVLSYRYDGPSFVQSMHDSHIDGSRIYAFVRNLTEKSGVI